jgi:hypothetical protein
MRNSLLLVQSTVKALTNRNYRPSYPFPPFRNFPENMSLPSPLDVERPIIIIMTLRISSMSVAKLKNLFVSPFFTSFATPTFLASISPVSNTSAYGVNSSIGPLQSPTCLKPSYCNPRITSYEAYLTMKPDLRTIRLLPIFSTLYVLRRTANAAA